MRRSNWTPSIVPRGDDHDVYLVVDDLGRLGKVWREADYETTDLETAINDLLTGQYGDLTKSSVSTVPKAGRATSRPTSPPNCAGAAICNRPMFPQACRNSSTGMTRSTASNCGCLSASSDGQVRALRRHGLGLRGPYRQALGRP